MGNSGSGLAYDIGEANRESQHYWSLHNGKRKVRVTARTHLDVSYMRSYT
jgi:hypothetical protein